MEILAKNEARQSEKAKKHANAFDTFHDIFYIIVCGVLLIFMLVVFLWITWQYLFTLSFSSVSKLLVAWLILILGYVVLVGGCMVTLAMIDARMKWVRGSEVISVQHGNLVIERKGCIFYKHKEIPLSTIQKVELFEGHVSWMWLRKPETLRLVCSKGRLSYIGLCMSNPKRKKLAERIMELVRENRES